jgi:hypothetical protein
MKFVEDKNHYVAICRKLDSIVTSNAYGIGRVLKKEHLNAAILCYRKIRNLNLLEAD